MGIFRHDSPALPGLQQRKVCSVSGWRGCEGRHFSGFRLRLPIPVPMDGNPRKTGATRRETIFACTPPAHRDERDTDSSLAHNHTSGPMTGPPADKAAMNGAPTHLSRRIIVQEPITGPPARPRRTGCSQRAPWCEEVFANNSTGAICHAGWQSDAHLANGPRQLRRRSGLRGPAKVPRIARPGTAADR